MIIIPIRRKMVPRSMYSGIISQGTMWRRTTTDAPTIATTARWIRSSMMSA